MPRRRSHARWAAPAALVASALAVFLVARPSGSDGDGPRAVPREGGGSVPAARTETTPPATTQTTPRASTYTVQAGDTLSAIAAETGVPVEDLRRLNPDTDPSALRVGEELALRDR